MKDENVGPPRFVTPVAWLLMIVVLAAVGYGVYRVGRIFFAGLDQVAERRAVDAEIVRAEREAGEAYMDSVSVEVEFVPIALDAPRGTLRFTVSNEAGEVVRRAVAEVSVPAVDSTAEHVERIMLFDDTETSVRPDPPLGPFETREISVGIDAPQEWDWPKAEAVISEMRVRITH